MDELPTPLISIWLILSDEVLSLPDWRQELASGGTD